MIKKQRLIILLCALLLAIPTYSSAAQDVLPSLTYSETVSGFLTTGQLTQTWVFTGSEREVVQITARRIGGQFTPHLRLFDGSGALLLAEGPSGETRDSNEIIFTAGLPSTGEYRIEVTSAGPITDRVDNPNEYSLSLNRIGTRRGNLVDSLPAIGTGNETPPNLISEDVIAADNETNPLGVSLYNAAEPVRQSDGGYSVAARSGSGQITASNARPISRIVSALSFRSDGLGFVSTTNTVFFTDRSAATLRHDPEGVVTITLGGDPVQTITTDFFNIASIQAVENLVEVRMIGGQRLILSGSTFDLRRGARRGNSDEPVFEIQLDGSPFIATDLAGWHTLAYLDGQLRVLYGQDSQLISDQLPLDLFQNDQAPAYAEITLYDPPSTGSTPVTVSLRIDWLSAASAENVGVYVIGDVIIGENSLRILPLDGRDILEDFSFSDDRRAVADLLIEQGAVRIRRADGTYRLSLPDSTEIMTYPATSVEAAVLPYEAGFVPQGMNNLGIDPMPTIPSQNTIAEALPVNPVNGNFYYAVQDFYIPSHTLELEFARYYNSQATALPPAYMLSNYPLGLMGQGWRHSYQMELDITQAPLGQLVLILPQGTRHIFNVLDDGVRYRSATLLSWTIERVGGILGRWVVATADGVQYQLDRAGRLQSITNAEGHALTFSPAPREYLSAEQSSGVFIVEPYGRRLELYADTNGQISAVRDTLSRQITYTHNNRALVEVQYIDFAQTATYSYNDDGLLSAFDDSHSPYHQRGVITYDAQRRATLYVENPDGDQPRRFDYTYDGDQRITTRTTQVTTLSGEQQTRTDTWQYDEPFLITNYTAPRAEFTYAYTYNRDSFLLSTVRQPDQTTFRFEFDAQGYLTQLRDPLYTNRSYQFTYETRGSRQLLQEVRYANGGRETFSYDDTPAARLIERRQLISEQPAVERVQRFVYDEWGRVSTVINTGANGEEVATVYTYDTFGYVSSIQVGDSPPLGFRYDLLGRLRLFTDGNGNSYALDWSSTQDLLTAMYGPEGYFQGYSYDELGRLIEWNDRGNLTRYSYSDLNQVTEITNPLQQTTTFRYDEANNLLSAVDNEGRTYQYTYDALNNLTSSTTPSGLVSTYEVGVEAGGSYTFRRSVDPAGRITYYRYDALGRLKRVALVSEETQRAYELTYDSVGNLTSMTDEFTGRNLRFTYDLIGAVTSSSIEDVITEYTYDSAGNLLTTTDPSGLITTYTHDVLGNVTGVMFGDGTQNSYRYDGNNNLVSITDALGQETTYAYDALNQVTSVTEPGGRSTQYSYDARSNLVSTTDPAGYTRTAAYDTLDRMISFVDAAGNETSYEYDALGRLINISAPLGLVTQYAYNTDDNIVAITQPSGRQTIFDYDVLGRLTSITDALGHTYVYSYNQFGNLAGVTDPLGNAREFRWVNGRPGSFTDGNGRSYQYNPDMVGRVVTIRDAINGGVNVLFDYDDAGRITGIHAGSDRLFSNSDETEWLYTYNDTRGWLETYTDPAGYVWTLTRDAAGRIVAVQDANGIFTRYEYDVAGNISRVIHAADTETETSERFVYDPNGNVIQYTAADGVVTTYNYDANNQLVEIREGVGTALERTFRYEYDAAGNLTRAVDPNGKETVYRYDPFGNLTRVILPRTEQTIEYQYTYDLMGNLTSAVLPEGQSINMSYDALNRRVRYVDAANGVWAYTYDNGGNLTQVSDPLGNVTRYEYDVFSRLARILYPDGAAVDLSYNQRGNIENVISPATGGTDERERTAYIIDAAGNLTTIVDNADSDDPSQTRFEYNARGQIISRRTPMDETTQYSYDALGRLTEIIYPDTSTQTRAYDAAGRLTSITSLTGTISFAYDTLGRLVEVRANDMILTYTYDAADHLMSRNSGDLGAVLYTYDDAYRPVAIQYGEQSIELVYDRNGWRTQLKRSNEVATNYTYDDNGRPEFITHITENGELLDGFSYTYDPVGNLTRIDRIDTWAVLYNYSASQRIVDERWLDEVNNARYTLSLDYDPAGNIIIASRDGVRTLYEYDAQNQLVREDRNYNPTEDRDVSWLPIIALMAGGAYVGRRVWRRWLWLSPVAMALLVFPILQQPQEPQSWDVSYSYRDDGNLLQITYIETGNTLDFSYDFESRLTDVVGTSEDGRSVDTHLTYDALGRVIEWRDGVERYQLSYDGETLIAIQSLSSSRESTRYFVPFPNEVLLSVFGEDNPIWTLQDAARSTRQLVDDSGILRDERFEYNVLGQLIAPYGQTAVVGNAPFPAFAGELFDPTTQLYPDIGERAYDPMTNRYLQRSPERHDPHNTLYSDFNPIDFAGTHPQNLPYRYLYEGTFAPQILDMVRPQPTLGSLLPPAEAAAPTTTQLQADENARLLQLAARLNGQQSVMTNFLGTLPSSPIAREAITSLLTHFTPDIGWLPNIAPDPLSPPDTLSIIADAQSLIADPTSVFVLPSLPDPMNSVAQPEEGLPVLLREVQMITGLLPEVEALLAIQPEVSQPNLPLIDIGIPEPRIVPPALFDLYNLYRSPLAQDSAIFPSVSSRNQQLTP